MGIPACFFELSDTCSLPLHIIQLTLIYSSYNADLLALIGVYLADGTPWGQEQSSQSFGHVEYELAGYK